MSFNHRMTSLAAVLLLVAGAALAQIHAHHTPPLTPDGPYPRMTPEELAASGYPDHRHATTWPGWQPLLDDDGEPYGPGSLCRGMLWLERDDVDFERGRMTLGRVKLLYNPGYKPCAVAPYLELTEMALLDVGDLLGLASEDTLVLDNTDLSRIYTTRTGQGVWRMYKCEGDTVVLQPIPVLIARSLSEHAAYDMSVAWLLAENGCGDLPAWLREGLQAYVAELGVHLNNYMLQFRHLGDIMLSPVDAEKILQSAPILDDGLDRELFRRARYMAFMMVWRLVEERGGLAPVREMLAAVAAGGDPDEAARAAWGLDLAALAVELDPNTLGEPIGDAVQSRKPHLRPEPAQTESAESDTQEDESRP